MRLDELTGRRVVLLGLGADVLAAVAAIRAAEPAELAVVEDGPAAESTNLPVLGLDEAAAVADVFVRSPGFPRYSPQLSAALERGALMTTPIDLWLGTHGPERTVIAITGTKGKSTVTMLLDTLAERGHVDIGVAGNVGTPVFSAGWNHEAAVVVLEISSYQAADLHHVPDLAVLTFLSEDHLSWHGDLETYTADKLRVVQNEGGTAPVVLIAADGGRAAGVLADRGIDPIVVEPPPPDPSVPDHRLQNAALAAEALASLGGHRLIDLEIVALARGTMPGRLDPCPGPADLLCLDDALASNPSATAAALRWLRGQGRETAVILGGADRHVGIEPLADEIAAWPEGRLRAVVLPDNGARIARACRIPIVAEADAVSDAARAAAEAVRPDGVVLFSPAAPTPDGSGDWEVRSAEFRETLRRMKIAEAAEAAEATEDSGARGQGPGSEPRSSR